MLKRLLNEDIIIETFLEPNLWIVNSDEVNIEQVIMNLAINAKDAMPDSGKLTIKTKNIYIEVINKTIFVSLTKPFNFN